MWTRPMAEMLADIAGSLLNLNADQELLHATSVELTLPIDLRLRRSQRELVLCADVPSWRWRTDFDPPFGQLQLRLEEARQEIDP